MQQHLKNYVSLLSLLILCLFSLTLPANPTPDTKIHDFALRMAKKHQFKAEEVEELLQNTTLNVTVLKSISKPAEKKPWYQYRPIFLDDQRIQGGVTFWRTHAAALAKAERLYGVPPEMIVAIIGAETRYGKITGNFSVLDALTTLAFYYPPRDKFFQDELEAYLLMTRERQLDPKTLRGSYAGAMGAPQFMPSTYRQYAVDFAEDGRVDLTHNIIDVIGSVANYFKEHGWQRGGIVAVPASIMGERYQRLNTDDLQLRLTLGDLADYGVTPQYAELPHRMHARLLVLNTEKGNDYWLGLNNFYVITQYNRSTNYAMAVYELAQAIRAGYLASTA